MSTSKIVPEDKAGQIKLIKRKIALFKGQITRANNFVREQHSQLLIDIESIEGRINALEQALKSYAILVVELSILNEDDEDFSQDEVEESCLRTIADLKRVLRRADRAETGTPVVKPEAPSSSSHKLPVMNIEVFDGNDITKFTSFFNIFIAIIDSDRSLSLIQKLLYLRSFLRGDALGLIEGLPLVPESYVLALELLKGRYDNKCLIIQHHVNALMDLPSMSRGSATELRHLVSQARLHLGALQGLGQPVQHWDMIIVPMFLRKLDSYSCRAYYSDRDQTKLPTLDDFFNFIEKRAIGFEESQAIIGKSNLNKFSKSTNLVARVPNTNKKECSFCNKPDHKLYQCQTFQTLGVKERIDYISKNNMCNICLNVHKGKCRFHFKCSICKSNEHNSLLHSESDSVCNIAKIPNEMVLLPTIKVSFKHSDGSKVTARGILDSGSQLSFIRSDFVSQLNVETFNYLVNVTALGQRSNSITKAVNLQFTSLHNDYSCNALFAVVDNITSSLPQTKFNLKNVQLPKVFMADNDYNVPSKIDFLLSADIFCKILLADKIELIRDELYLLNTQFGHILSGKLVHGSVCLSSQYFNKKPVSLLNNDHNLDTILQKFWEEQNIPQINVENLPTHICENHFRESVQLIDSRFQVKLPLKCPLEDLVMGDSFTGALRRLNSLCRRFVRDPKLKQDYVKFINEYLNLGHATLVDLRTLQIPFKRCYFLPHHPVIREERVTTKLRVVFDASAKTDKKISLNDILFAGPVVQKDLFDILIRFRSYKFVLMTDIKQMYRQVLIDPSQRHLQQILWKEKVDDPLKCLQLNTVTYGVTSSSYLATRCLLELAQRFNGEFPLASSILRSNTYIDDCLFGANSIRNAIDLRNEIKALASLGSFELHKWCSNNPELLAGIPPEKCYFQDVNFDSNALTFKALGLMLNISKDQFIITRPKGDLPEVWTKRSILSFIGTFFDPLGFVGPIVTRAKEFLQKVWRERLEWDTPLPCSLLQPWNLFFTQLMNLQPIHVKRDLMINGADYIDLVGFCDASNIAYGACLYLRAVHGQKVYMTLICAKSRIAPSAQRPTIPRLELNACVLLANLIAKTIDVFSSYTFRNKVLYTDSQIALSWIKNPPSKDIYIYNRVVKIRTVIRNCLWSHIDGNINPADSLSRGLMPSDLASNTLWWHGPKEFLSQLVIQNAYEVSSDPPNLLVASINCNVASEALPLLNKISSFFKMQRIVCYILRFIAKCRPNRSNVEMSKPFTAIEYKKAMSLILRQVQSVHFFEEINCIKQGKTIKTNVKKLNPFIDKEGVMRVGGRIENANIPFSQKFPAILPKKCHVTDLLIRNEHTALLHAGLKLTLSSLTQKFYIIGATIAVKRIISKCVPCFRFRAQRAKQLMAALPQDRVVQDCVFSKVGIDYCGPFSIKQSSIRRSIVSKGYVCVFVCFVTKSVHLELVSDLTTDSFLAAFKRFYSRRGLPQIVYCDNASTFKGANNKLRQLYNLCRSSEHQNSVSKFCSEKGIEFKFIPSYSPTFGGLWEAAVKSAKYHFKRVIGSMLLTFEQFNTVIIQVEAMLNSRPITQFSSDSSDFSFLTPGHFLINRSLSAVPEGEIRSNSINALHFWRKCTKIQQDFWKSWHKNYLSQLLHRPKWQTLIENIKEGSLVLLIGDNVSPLQWPVARVSKIFKGVDGNVRVVEVKTSTGSHRRAVNKVAVLPVYD